MSTHQVLPGLVADGDSRHGYVVRHNAGSLMTGYQRFDSLREAREAANVLALLGVDWTEPIESIRDQLSLLGREYTQAVRWILLPEVERERQRRVSDNSVRYLRHLQAQGETVLSTESLGIAGTIYHVSCGCQRTYSVSLTGMEPSEGFHPCEKHKGLTIPPEPTDRESIQRALREQRQEAGVA